ncbi:glycosyltransferase family 4 protein [Actinomadura sp. WMMA1423]|uniref:glycosyltransferase family 4 protein n=1 Tax=Actinomadura sp. WMMA1423 TaxID=2591108 RepID=UPI00143CFB91|nr:glycosyltransferase family 4 protein [Actinomadura sp. WMMA1423]
MQDEPVKKTVYLAGLAWRQLRDDPGRASRLAVRLAARTPLGARLRRSRLVVPKPRDVRREIRDLRLLLSRPSPPATRRAVQGGDAAGEVGGVVLQFVTNALPLTNAGYTVRTHRIALAQREMGLDPHIVTRLGYPLSQGAGAARARVDVDGVAYHRLLSWLPQADPLDAVAKSADLAGRLVRELRPSVLHAVSNHLNAAVALELGRRHGLPVVYEVRGFLEDSWLSRDPAHSEDDEFYRLTRELETRRMAEADAVVTLGEAMRAEIASRGVPEEKIFTVPNGVDEAFLEPLPDASGLREELGIDRGATVVGLTSSFYGYEGIDTLIDAAALLRDRGSPVTLLLVGDGPERGALERRAAGHGVHAVFTGRVPMESVRRYHAVLDVFAVPRRADRVCQLVTPLKPIEAMAGGIPVIASDVKALREIVEPGVTGALTVPENPESWANCLEELAYSHERRQKIGRSAREWVAAERTWRAVTAGYRAAYRFAVSHGA